MNAGTAALRTATCLCGQLRATCRGEPVRVSVCHCLNCQKRSGSAFAAQARWPDEAVTIAGEWRTYVRPGVQPGEGVDGNGDGNGNGGEAGGSGACAFHFCPTCGGGLFYRHDDMPGLTAVAIGAFADPLFPAPHYSVFEARRQAWVAITGAATDHFD